MKRARQASFEFKSWGGARRGAGRKRNRALESVEHRARPKHVGRHPVHVTLRIERGLESLRKRRTHRIVRDALVAGCGRHGLRIVHYSAMTNHVHLVCEAPNERALSCGMKGLCVRIARGLNGLWGRTGRVIADRYHARALKSPREVRNALHYLLHNARHHGIHFAGPDPCSSGVWFDGWDRVVTCGSKTKGSPLARAHTWLLSVGWKRHGVIALAPLARRHV
ncbi:MAG: transposase [Planctomycetes bacterium]|nr:transposase [Planctomycetota bacterium]